MGGAVRGRGAGLNETRSPGGRLSTLAEQVLWRAYEHAPAAVEPVIALGRRHVLHRLRRSIPVSRIFVEEGSHGPALTAGIVGTGLVGDYFRARLFPGDAEVEAQPPIRPGGLDGLLAGLARSCDVVLAVVPRASAKRLGPGCLRLPSLIAAGLPIASDLTATLATASCTVRRQAREVETAGYTWTFAADMADFERFHDEFHRPFVTARFGPLARLRRKEELRREFRHGGGIIWSRLAGRTVGGGLVRVRGASLGFVAEGVAPAAEAVPPGPQVALNVAACEMALAGNLSTLDLGGAMPALRDGVVRAKRAWGAAFTPSSESHRDLLLSWRMPTHPAVMRLLAELAPVFATRHGLAALTVAGPGHWRPAATSGIAPLLVLGAEAGQVTWPFVAVDGEADPARIAAIAEERQT